MATTDSNDSTDGSSGGSDSGGALSGIIDFLMQPLGMMAVVGFLAAVVAGYYVL